MGLDFIQIKLHLSHFYPLLLINTEAASPKFFLRHLCPQEFLWKRQDLVFFKPSSSNQWRAARSSWTEECSHSFHHNIPPHTSRITSWAWISLAGLFYSRFIITQATFTSYGSCGTRQREFLQEGMHSSKKTFQT